MNPVYYDASYLLISSVIPKANSGQADSAIGKPGS